MPRVKATLDGKRVEVIACIPRELTIYEYIDDETASMKVLGNIEKQDGVLNEETGFIELIVKNYHGSVLKMKPTLFDEVTCVIWNENTYRKLPGL